MTTTPDPTDKAADGQFQPAREGEIERLIRLARSGASLYPGEGKKLVEHYEASARDAERWRALLGCERVRMLGYAGIGTPDALLGVEFYARHPFTKGSDDSRRALTEFAESLLAARAATREEGTPR